MSVRSLNIGKSRDAPKRKETKKNAVGNAALNMDRIVQTGGEGRRELTVQVCDPLNATRRATGSNVFMLDEFNMGSYGRNTYALFAAFTATFAGPQYFSSTRSEPNRSYTEFEGNRSGRFFFKKSPSEPLQRLYIE